MVLCIPLTGMIKVVCDHIGPLKPYGFMIGEETRFRERKARTEQLWNKIRKPKNKQQPKP
jgi:hypothetical protein